MRLDGFAWEATALVQMPLSAVAWSITAPLGPPAAGGFMAPGDW